MEKRPLGMPIWVSYCLSFQALFGIPRVANGVDQPRQSTPLMLLYHVLLLLTSPATFPASLGRLAQRGDDVWGEGNPAGAMRVSAHTLQHPGVTPIGNRRHVDLEQFRRRQGGVAPIAALSGGTEARTLWASEGNAVGRADPVHFAGGTAAAQPWAQPRRTLAGWRSGSPCALEPTPAPKPPPAGWFGGLPTTSGAAGWTGWCALPFANESR
jgi:hypothetical protein